MSSQIQLYLANNSLLDEKQSRFRKKRSCITAITNIVEDIRQELDSNCVTFLTLLDHSEAFDFVNHNILCTKLRNMFNFSTNATKLIRSYLTNRYQAVVSGRQVSSLRNLSRGVPQGSVLGHLLFSINVNDLPSILSECEVHLYADDVQIYVSRPVTEIHACVLPTLFYGIEIFGNCDARDLRTLTVAFNSIVRYVLNLRRFDHVSELTYKILDLNLPSWIDLRILI